MRQWKRSAPRLAAVLVIGSTFLGCGDDGSTPPDGGGDPDTSTGTDSSTSMDSSTTPDARTSMDGGVRPTDAEVVIFPDGWGAYPDGGCVPVTCSVPVPWQCADCIDNDGDGRTDAFDPDCLGPCDNNEGGFDLDIPGGDAQPCRLDCYYDQDEGAGTDGCRWDHRCDMLEPDPAPLCMYMDPPPADATCPATQTTMCHDVCSPITPNGCDCFGCCELPARSGRYVFIGSVNAAGESTCTLDVQNDDSLCHPCTPVGDCLNTCERCELCLGRTTIPADCLDPPTDAGVPPTDGGNVLRCPGGEQPCGLPGDFACSEFQYCVTGCCQDSPT